MFKISQYDTHGKMGTFETATKLSEDEINARLLYFVDRVESARTILKKVHPTLYLDLEYLVSEKSSGSEDAELNILHGKHNIEFEQPPINPVKKLMRRKIKLNGMSIPGYALDFNKALHEYSHAILEELNPSPAPKPAGWTYSADRAFSEGFACLMEVTCVDHILQSDIDNKDILRNLIDMRKFEIAIQYVYNTGLIYFEELNRKNEVLSTITETNRMELSHIHATSRECTRLFTSA